MYKVNIKFDRINVSYCMFKSKCLFTVSFFCLKPTTFKSISNSIVNGYAAGNTSFISIQTMFFQTDLYKFKAPDNWMTVYSSQGTLCSSWRVFLYTEGHVQDFWFFLNKHYVADQGFLSLTNSLHLYQSLFSKTGVFVQNEHSV